MSEFEYIEAEKAFHPVTQLCEALSVSVSGYYAHQHREESLRKQEDERLGKLIERIFLDSRKTYGAPRITDTLREQGESVSQKRVARLMRKKGLDARPKKAYVVTTTSAHVLGFAPNLLKRNFHTAGPNQVWVGATSRMCPPTKAGFIWPPWSTCSLAVSWATPSTTRFMMT